jgi:outer membrane protein
MKNKYRTNEFPNPIKVAMKMRDRMVFFILINLPILAVSAQNNWNLNQCIKYSIENNITIKNSDISLEVQQIKLTQARFNQFPQIGADISATESYGRSLDPATNTYGNVNNYNNSFGVSTSLTLFSGFTQRNKIAFEKYNLIAEKNRFEQQKNKVIYNVINAYYTVLLNQGIFSLYLDNLRIMQEQYYSIKRQIEVGRKAESDIFEFDAKLAADSFLMVQQSGNVDKTLIQLKATMNFPFSDSLIVDSVTVLIGLSADTINSGDLIETAKHELPDLRVTENGVFAAKKYLAQAKGSFSPSISLYAGWNTNYYKSSGTDAEPFNNQFKNNAGEYFGLTLNIPIFGKLSKINSLRAAKMEYQKSQNIHQENIKYVEKEINEAYIDWQTSKKEYLSAQKQLDKNKIAFLTAEKKLGIGQINMIDFYIQKNELLKAKTELLRASLQLSLKEKYIHFLLTGEWIEG